MVKLQRGDVVSLISIGIKIGQMGAEKKAFKVGVPVGENRVF